jgi:hypothetical protein
MGLELAVACAVKTKLEWYVLPALPPVALLCGSLLGAALAANEFRANYVPHFAAIAVALLIIEMPLHWRSISQAMKSERELSRPSYALGLRAHELGAAYDVRELVFVGDELPTLVYYSGLRSHFIPFSWPDFPDLPHNQVALREPDGALDMVGNLTSEWSVSGPRNERAPVAGSEAVCRGTPWKAARDNLQISLAE